ncbi:MAG: aminotransferase class V-fold PLP-dependent enzyme [Chitinophagaceae bacterium]|nr:aminotransferase class V-fold PLP-dependent enzyme [Chitinophagaceae bacterium]
MEKNEKNHNVSSVLSKLGEERELYFNSIAPPIVQTSNFYFKKVEDFENAITDEYSTSLYSRGRNPTVDILKEKIAALDGAEDCLIVNSGSTAIFVSVLSQVKAGDHIIAVNGVYAWAQKMFDNVLPRFGVTTTWIDGSDINNFKAAIRDNTRLIYLESPTSWVFEEQDLPAVAALARSRNIITVIDNTYFTPLYQQPIKLGIDITLQSASKYISGHSDTIGGVICASAAIIKKIYNSEFLNIGAGAMPFNAWLLLRGLRTLPVRLERLRQSTPVVLSFLENHPAVEKILAPRDVFGLFTIILKTKTRKSIISFCESLNNFPMAVSWGGYESLIMPKCVGVSDTDFNTSNEIHRSVRIYIGLEDPEFLINDLSNALSIAFD